jgi:hypothetical protein
VLVQSQRRQRFLMTMMGKEVGSVR